MARKRGSRRRPHRDATRRGPGRREHPAAGIEDDPLLHGLRQSLRSSPVDFGALVASIHYITTDETMDALGGPPDGMEGPPMSLNDLVESIIDIDISETTHALHVLAALIDDELLAARIRRALTTRRQPVHPAVERFGEVEVRDAYLITEPTGRSDEILLAARWPDGTEATLILLISHIVGGAITDFLVSQDGNAATAEHIRTSSADHGLQMTAIDPADARATLRRAIDAWVEEMPDIEEGMWPDALPFLEFLLKRMPTGGQIVGSGGRWTDDWADDLEIDDITELAHDFLDSDEIGDPDDDLDHEIAHVIARFATMFLDDPLRWTTQSAELAMTTALPIQLTGDEDEFARTPTLVRAFIRYAHARLGLPAELTLAVTQEVDRHEEVFHLLRDDPDIVGARIDLMASAAEELRMDGLGWGMRRLVDRLGSVEAVDALTDEPLPDEDLDLSAVPEDVWDRVRATADLTDRVSDELIGDREIRTACRRLLTIAAREDPRIFRRRSRDDTAAAAVAWIVGRANGVFGWGGRVQIKELMDTLGLPPGSPSQRAQPFLDALGVDRYQRLDGQSLGTPDLLTSTTRRRLIDTRDRLRGLDGAD
ncbi:MAG TPA: hypothetical protein GXZ60_12930 [Intrasporangiaceae bacterium]|nr:hypothetical protein [Intrasporangiaceae bacterium]